MAALNDTSTPVRSSSTLSSIANIGSLAGKVALITGGSSGLGRAISQAYAAAGAFVIVADLTPNPPKAPILANTLNGTDLTTPTVDLINSQYPATDGLPKAIYTECNVTSTASWDGAVAAGVKQYGRLDIMVNSAGIALEPDHGRQVHLMPEDIWDKTMAVNGKGTWLGCRVAAAQMLAQPPHASGDRGWIINLCSIAGLVGLPGATCYSASKGAVLQMTKAIALDYAKDKIHVNCINPGFIETSMLEPIMAGGGEGGNLARAGLTALHPWGRLGLPDDIAKAAVFLAGDGASFMTGQTLVIDGGYVAR